MKVTNWFDIVHLFWTRNSPPGDHVVTRDVLFSKIGEGRERTWWWTMTDQESNNFPAALIGYIPYEFKSPENKIVSQILFATVLPFPGELVIISMFWRWKMNYLYISTYLSLCIVLPHSSCFLCKVLWISRNFGRPIQEWTIFSLQDKWARFTLQCFVSIWIEWSTAKRRNL